MEIKSKILLLLISIGLHAFAPCSEAKSISTDTSPTAPEVFQDSEKSQWLATSLPLQGVALVIHGLNNKPSVMNPIAQSLRDNGVSVFRLALSGHSGAEASMKSVTTAQWQNDTRAGLAIAWAEAQSRKVPLYVVGYSLGAVTALNALVDSQQKSGITSELNSIKVTHFFLFAPAIAARWRVSLLSLLSPFPALTIPSANNPQYRAVSGASIAAYNALRSQISDFETALNFGLFALTHVTVFVRHHDEAVSFGKIKEITSKLAHWNLVELDDTKQNGYFRHLILDSKTLGQSNWDLVTSHMDGIIRLRPQKVHLPLK